MAGGVGGAICFISLIVRKGKLVHSLLLSPRERIDQLSPGGGGGR